MVLVVCGQPVFAKKTKKCPGCLVRGRVANIFLENFAVNTNSLVQISMEAIVAHLFYYYILSTLYRTQPWLFLSMFTV